MGILADGSGGGGAVVGLLLLYVVIYLVGVLPLWFIFKKAGKTGWYALIPIYNVIVVLEIVGRPIWWIILFLIPLVGFIVWIIVALDLAKSFGRGSGFGVGLIFLPWIFEMILAFGQSAYVGPAAAPGQRPAAAA